MVLNYWASWCLPCREETPLLQRWHERILPRGGTVLGVDALDATGDAQAFIRRFHLTYPILRDRDGDTDRAFGVRGYPETLVLDRGGRVLPARDLGPPLRLWTRAATLQALRDRLRSELPAGDAQS